MNAPEAVSILYEAVHPFGTAYVAGDIFHPRDIAKAQAAVYEVARAIKLGEVEVDVEASIGGNWDMLTLVTTLYRAACAFGRKPFPGDIVEQRHVQLAAATVDWAQRCFKMPGIRVRKAARA